MGPWVTKKDIMMNPDALRKLLKIANVRNYSLARLQFLSGMLNRRRVFVCCISMLEP